MKLPEFTAEASLYRPGGHYRASDSGFGDLLPTHPTVPAAREWSGSISTVVSWTDVIAKTWAGSPWSVGIGRTVRSSCDAVGKPCCGPDAEVKTQHCHKGLGCNVTTGQCEACGGPGQVCCDGHFTGFSLKGYTGILLDPAERIYSCNPGGRCDATLAADGVTWTGSRRCQTCGNKLNGACCAPDNYYGLAHCFVDTEGNGRLVCDDPWGTGGRCVRCGTLGLPVCQTAGESECDAGLVEENGRCVHCGRPGEPPCDWTGCDKQDAVLDKKSNRCVHAGRRFEPCKQDGTCDRKDLFCNEKKICTSCGWSWSHVYPEQCCPPSTGGPPCFEGECRLNSANEHRCLCGYADQPPCQCGKEGQRICGNNQCMPGYSNVQGICRKVGSGGGTEGGSNSEQWKTCDGEDWGSTTQDRSVAIKFPTKCIEFVSYKANSAEEAYKCAHRDYGDTVVTETVNLYKFAQTNEYGCTALTIPGTDESEAQECAQLSCINCTVTPGDCP